MEEDQIPQGEIPQIPTQSKIPALLKKNSVIIGMILISIVFVVPLVLFVSSTINQNSKATPTPTEKNGEDVSVEPYIPDQLIVKYKLGQTPEEIQDENKKRSLENFLTTNGVLSQEKLHETNDPVLRTYFVLKLKKGVDLQKLTPLLKGREEVESVELNYVPEPF